MKVGLPYGRERLHLDLAGHNATVIEPEFTPGLPCEESAFTKAVRSPFNSPPLREIIAPGERLAVVIADITRPLPSERLLPWLFRELPQIHPEQVVIIVGTGSHRTNTKEEVISMVGDEIAHRYRIVNHDGHDPESLAPAGMSSFGYPVSFNREYVEADRRIIVGFIEPHFMAGFSGGYKAVFPGITGVDAIMRYHGVDNIGHPRSTWGILDGNPTQESVRAGGSLIPVEFCINVSLNRNREITGFFCGHPIDAHEAGCRFVKQTAMVPCPQPFPVVVTTNSGYPLDQNLYQSVKGMSAGAEILAPGGLILIAARCNDGFPDHGNFRKQLFAHHSAKALLETLYTPGFSEFDQWETQKLAQILLKGRIAILSDLNDGDVVRAHMIPISDMQHALEEELERVGRKTPVAVLPEGPQTIPYICQPNSRRTSR